MVLPIHRAMTSFGPRRVFPQKIVVIPIGSGPDRARYEAASAVGAHISEKVFHTGSAERTFKRADARFGGFRWKRSFAVLTDRSQLEHRTSSLAWGTLCTRIAWLLC